MCALEGDVWLKYVPAISAVFSAIAAFASAASVFLQHHNAKENRALDILLKKETEWDGDRMRKFRAKAAAALLMGNTLEPSIQPILDFIDSIGLHAQRNSIPIEMVWESFFYWFDGYMRKCRETIEPEQKKDRTVWEHATWLHKKISAIQRKKAKRFPFDDEANLTEFLQEECDVWPPNDDTQ